VKITELRVQGYRSLKDVTWRPGDLNVLIGPNGGGKSNLLRVLQLLQAAADRRLSKWIQREGGMIPMVWDGSATQFCIEVVSESPGQESAEHAERLLYRLLLARRGSTGDYFVPEEFLGKLPTPTDRADGEHSTYFEAARFGPEMPAEAGGGGAGVGKITSPREAMLGIFGGEPFPQAPVRSFHAQVLGWAVYCDFHTGRDSVVRQSAVSRHEPCVNAMGDNLVCVLHTLYTNSREFRHDIDSAMSAVFGEDYEELIFPPESDQRIQLRVRWKSMTRAQSAADLSDGMLRFLYLLAILANPEPPPLIAIDEPETGLHPRMQHVIAEFTVDAARRTQVVLTTHSPEFLDSYDSTIPRVTVVEPEPGAGTALRNLCGDELKRWTREFGLGEIMRTNSVEAIQTEQESGG